MDSKGVTVCFNDPRATIWRHHQVWKNHPLSPWRHRTTNGNRNGDRGLFGGLNFGWKLVVWWTENGTKKLRQTCRSDHSEATVIYVGNRPKMGRRSYFRLVGQITVKPPLFTSVIDQKWGDDDWLQTEVLKLVNGGRCVACEGGEEERLKMMGQATGVCLEVVFYVYVGFI